MQMSLFCCIVGQGYGEVIVSKLLEKWGTASCVLMVFIHQGK